MTMWNNVILCLGSNTDCEANLKSAVSLLRAYFGSIRFSERGEAGCEGDGKAIGTHVGQ